MKSFRAFTISLQLQTAFLFKRIFLSKFLRSYFLYGIKM